MHHPLSEAKIIRYFGRMGSRYGDFRPHMPSNPTIAITLTKNMASCLRLDFMHDKTYNESYTSQIL